MMPLKLVSAASRAAHTRLHTGRTLPWSHGQVPITARGRGGLRGRGRGEGWWMCSEMNESLQKEQDAHEYKQPTPLL